MNSASIPAISSYTYDDVTVRPSLADTRNASHRIVLLLYKLGLARRAIPEGMVVSSLSDRSLYVKTKTDLVRLSSMYADTYPTNTYSGYAGSGGGVYKVHTSFWSDATTYPAGSMTYTSGSDTNDYAINGSAEAWVEGTGRCKLDDEE
jgi:hypothetical protein